MRPNYNNQQNNNFSIPLPSSALNSQNGSTSSTSGVIPGRHASVMTTSTMQTFNTVSTGLSDKSPVISGKWVEEAKKDLSAREKKMSETKLKFQQYESLENLEYKGLNLKRKRKKRKLAFLVVLLLVAFGGVAAFFVVSSGGSESNEEGNSAPFTSTDSSVIEQVCKNYASVHGRGEGSVFSVCLDTFALLTCVLDGTSGVLSGNIDFFICAEGCECGSGVFIDERNANFEEVSLNRSCTENRNNEAECRPLANDDSIDLEDLGRTSQPTASPTQDPTDFPTNTPTPEPTNVPTPEPTNFPTTPAPTLEPTNFPTPQPTNFPTPQPTGFPTLQPTNFPTLQPTPFPTLQPTNFPTPQPTNFPTPQPTPFPTFRPTNFPTPQPTNFPSRFPTFPPGVNIPRVFDEGK